MLLAPLIIAMAGIACVTLRIVRGVGQTNRAGDHRERTPPRKISDRFQRYKHTSLIFLLNETQRFRRFSDNGVRNVRRNAWQTVAL
jgi:hypothetical protein